jgi:hypothetical protein
MRGLSLLAAAIAGLAGGVAQAAPVVGADAVAAPAELAAPARREVVDRLATLLETRYLDPAVGARYAAELREQQARGAYDRLSDPAAFALRVTADLQAVSPDAHLRVAPAAVFSAPRSSAPGAPASTRPSGPPGLEAARMIGDVAYLRFNAFPQDPGSGAAARAFLLAHADARAVILDARPLRGGGQAVMDALLPLFYARPATLVRMDTRAEADGGDEPFASMVRQPSPAGIVRRDHRVEPDRTETRLQRTPLFYLTSRRTASAGEHLALALKRTHRGVLVGETTAGAGHFGWLEALPHGFAAFVPVGRTYDPDTGLDWEGRGVAPDIASPADEALNAALARIRQADIPPAALAAVQSKP